MLAALAKEHQAQKAKHKQEQEINRKATIEASNEMTVALVDHLNISVAQTYLNQKRLDAEAKQLLSGATTFHKQTQQWMHLIENFSSALKELGDVENWARTIENDVQDIHRGLELAYKRQRQLNTHSAQQQLRRVEGD